MTEMSDISGSTGMAEPQGERLSRFLAHAGIASRRHAEVLIASGRVQVNGETITAQGSRVDPEHDTIMVDGKPVIAATQHIYLLLHKPAGYVSTAHDPQGRPTVLDLLPPDLRRLRVYPVGRLDSDTSGLLLMTNDGNFTLRLTHPRYSMVKYYRAIVEGYPTEAALEQLRTGVTFIEDDGRKHTSAPAKVRIVRNMGPDCELEIVLHEGRKRQVRRMLAVVDHRVLALRRTGIGPLRLDGVQEGKWRHLTEEEVDGLMG